MARRPRIDKSTLAFGVPARVRDRKHLVWLRDLPCVRSRKPGPCDPAHISIGNAVGKGLKAGDNHAVPLNHFEHVRQHKIGERTFWGDDLDRAQALAVALHENSGDTPKALILISRFWRAQTPPSYR